jgi:hypothetical protein
MIAPSALSRLIGALALASVPLVAGAQAPDTPGVSVRADLGPTPRIKAGEPERAPPSGNPLWAILLKDLSDTRERPIFTPSRRPPPLRWSKSPTFRRLRRPSRRSRLPNR